MSSARKMSLRLITFGVEIIAGGCTSCTDRANRFRLLLGTAFEYAQPGADVQLSQHPKWPVGRLHEFVCPTPSLVRQSLSYVPGSSLKRHDRGNPAAGDLARRQMVVGRHVMATD